MSDESDSFFSEGAVELKFYSVVKERLSEGKKAVYALSDAMNLFLNDYDAFWKTITCGPETINTNALCLT